MMPRLDLVRRLLFGLAIACLTGCQTTSSPHPLFSIPGVTRITPPATWQEGAVTAKLDLSNPAGSNGQSGPPAIRDPDAFQGTRLKWKAYSSPGEFGSGVVAASYDESRVDRPVGSGVRPASYQETLIQPPTRTPASSTLRAKSSGGWSSRHEPQATGR